jgi:hypothetical protein
MSIEACINRYPVYALQKLFIAVKWQSLFGVHKVQVSLPGRCLIADDLVRNYGAADMAPTQEESLLFSLRRQPHNKHINGLETIINYVTGPNGARAE